jgi:putative intracellular protease/amidase
MQAKPTAKRTGLRIFRILGYALAFMALPALVALVNVKGYADHRAQASPAFTGNLTPPPHDPDKPTVAIVLSNVWTEITDVLGPYEVLTASGAYNVYAVAPEHRLSPLNGVLDVMPHFSFAEFEAQGLKPDIVVVPYMTQVRSAANAPVLAWIKERADEGSRILSICLGAEVVAAAGVLDGHQATTYWLFFNRLEREYPTTDWVRGVRYVDDGDVISSAGITSGIDGTLYLLGKFKGNATALEVARRINYPHTRFLNDPRRDVPDSIISVLFTDLLPFGLSVAYRWDKPSYGVTLYDGVGELELASILDTYPTAALAYATTLAAELRPYTTEHGLTVVPRAEFSTAPRLDRLLIPGVNAGLTQELTTFARERGIEVETPHRAFAGTGARYPFDAVLSDIAERDSKAVANAASIRIEYPIDHLLLQGNDWPIYLLLRPLALGLLGVAVAVGARRGFASLTNDQGGGTQRP